MMRKILLALLAALLPAAAVAQPAPSFRALTLTTAPQAGDNSSAVPTTGWVHGNTVVSLDGKQGVVSLGSADVTGALGYAPLAPANNLGDVASPATARVNLGNVPAISGTPTAGDIAIWADGTHVQDGGTLAGALAGVSVNLGSGSTAPTQGLADGSTKLATDAFVLGRGVAYTSYAGYAASATVAACGGFVVANSATPITLTLPPSVACYSGGTVTFYNGNTGLLTIAAQGSDNVGGGAASLPYGASETLTTNGGGNWRLSGRFDNAPLDSPEMVGAVADALNLWSTGVSISAGSPSLTVAGAGFTAADATVRKAIVVPGAGAPIAAPGAPALTASSTGLGGVLVSGSVYVKLTYLSAAGETAPSAESVVGVTGPTGAVEVSYPGGGAGVTGYNVYAASSSGAEVLQNAQPIHTGQIFLLNHLVTGSAAPPASSSAGAMPLVTTIAGYIGPTQVTLAASAAATLSAVAEAVTYGTDDTGPLNACAAQNAAVYGECRLRGGRYLATGNLIVPSNVVLKGASMPVTPAGNGGFTDALRPLLFLAPGATVQLNGQMGGVTLINAGEPDMVPNVQALITATAAFSGTGVTLTGAAALRDSRIIGFETCVTNAGNGGFHFDNLVLDCAQPVSIPSDSAIGMLNNIWPRVWQIEDTASDNPTSVAISGLANNGAGADRLTVNSTANFATGNLVLVSGVAGSVPSINQRWHVTVVDGTHLDLQGSSFSGSYGGGGSVLLRPFYSGPALAVTKTTGLVGTNFAPYGFDGCYYLGADADWVVIANANCDNLNIADTATVGADFEAGANGNRLLVGYFSSQFYPVIDRATAGSDGSFFPNKVLGGELYTSASVTSQLLGTDATIKVLSGHLILAADNLSGNYIEVATGASLQLGACFTDQEDGGASATPSAFWWSGSDLGKVEWDDDCRVGAPPAGSVTNAPVLFVPSPASGATQVLGPNATGLLLENTSSLSSQTIRLPAITGDYRQSFVASSIGGVGAATFETTTGAPIANAPTSMPALTPREFDSDGANWQPVH